MPTLEEVSFPTASSGILTMGGQEGFFARPIEADEPYRTGEDYSEPVAWAKLLGVNIARYGTDGFLLAQPGSSAGLFPTCSPSVLTRLVKLYAEAVGVGSG